MHCERYQSLVCSTFTYLLVIVTHKEIFMVKIMLFTYMEHLSAKLSYLQLQQVEMLL